jgi:hypothetical protein
MCILEPFINRGRVVYAKSKEEAIKIFARKLELQPISNPIKTKYVFHTSPPTYRRKILSEGLIPKIGDNYKWHWDAYYKPSELPKGIFLANGRVYDTMYDDDIWIVKVSELKKTKLFKDPDKRLGSKDYCLIYTEKIPTSAIELIYEGTGKPTDEMSEEEKEKMNKSTGVLKKYK